MTHAPASDAYDHAGCGRSAILTNGEIRLAEELAERLRKQRDFLARRPARTCFFAASEIIARQLPRPLKYPELFLAGLVHFGDSAAISDHETLSARSVVEPRPHPDPRAVEHDRADAAIPHSERGVTQRSRSS